MDGQLKPIFSRLRETCDLAEADCSDVNACCSHGDNALHFVVRKRDVSAAKALIDAGVDVNKAGDLCYTPLHVACMQGDAQMVKLLVDQGADLFALSEGDAPFAVARRAGHDHICDLLGPLMAQAQSLDPKTWVRARIARLRREIADLEPKNDQRSSGRIGPDSTRTASPSNGLRENGKSTPPQTLRRMTQ